MACPCCRSTNVEDFYTVENAPSQSIVTIKTYEEAIAIPRKDIALAFCNECGFIFNRSFDASIDFFTKGYEDQQGFSATFNAFLKGVTQDFIDKYDVRGKDIIEIGCGKGDFLQLICKLGNNRGIGIDPAYMQGRLEVSENVRFIKELFSEDHGNLPCDVITCRHTLEHIQDTNGFVQKLHKSVDNNPEIIVFIEVPNIVRILKVNAFWDVFYEHCSYFSPGSLARLFRLNKFEVLDTYLGYNDQYLFIEAKYSPHNFDAVHPLEESVEQLSMYVNKFVESINKELGYWSKLLLNLKSKNKKVVIWGGGSKSVGFLTHFNHLQVVKYVVDINIHMQGNFIPGIGIQYVPPEFLKTFKPDIIIVMNEIYRNEIRDLLTYMDLLPELICL